MKCVVSGGSGNGRSAEELRRLINEYFKRDYCAVK